MKWKLQAYDIHAESPAGRIHFQVLQTVEKSLDDAKKIAEKYLKFAKNAKMTAISKTASTQGAAPGQETSLEKDGFYIFKVHGCPEDRPAAEPATSE